MDYLTMGKAAVAIGCVLLLVWAVESLLGRIATALWGIANEIKATRVFWQNLEQQRSSLTSIAEMNAQALRAEQKRPAPVLNDDGMSPEAKRVLDQLQAQQNAFRGAR